MKRIFLFSGALVWLVLTGATSAQTAAPIVVSPDHVAVSKPLRDGSDDSTLSDRKVHSHPPTPRRPQRTPAPDEALQTTVGPVLDTRDGANFAGVGASGFAPPDTNMAVGPNHILQTVNSRYAIYSKAGALLAGPYSLATIWAPLGGSDPCSTSVAGDVVAQYDTLADRFIVTQLGGLSAPYSECVAVSQTSDPTGSYWLYSYPFGTTLNDYPKFGVWPTAHNSAYLATYNLFANGKTFTGGQLCAYDRSKMLVGDPTAQGICYTIQSDGGYEPADLDGVTPPLDGTPGLFLTYETLSSLRMYGVAPNFANPSASTLSLETPDIPVASFSEACAPSYTCVPQAGTRQTLDSLGDRLMYRLAFRNFGNHEALVINHSVASGSTVGVRWYELRAPVSASGAFTLFQQGTYAPDATYRWMGSAAMDRAGDVAVGYSASSSAINPAIRYTGRSPSDPAGILGSEVSMLEGTGSQTGNLSRWGDYSAMRIDPADDCTFWYTNEYLVSDGSFNWSTFFGSFKFAGCSPPAIGPPTVYIDAPSQGSTVSGTVTVSGWALDNSSAVGTAIGSVQIKVDGVVVGNAAYGTSRPDVCGAYPGRVACPNVGFTYQWNTTALAAGSHTLTATATDTDTSPESGSFSATVTVNSVPPTVNIDVPSRGSTVSGTVTVAGWAIDNSSVVGTAIGGVQIKVDGVVVGGAVYGTNRQDVCNAYPGRAGCPNVGFTYQWNTTGLAAGSHTLTATATDTDASPDAGSFSTTVTVNPPPPTVDIDVPGQGSTVSGTVTVAGWAIDNSSVVGTAIGSVQIKVDGVVVGTATYGTNRQDVCSAYPGRVGCPNVGFTYQWNTTTLTAGSHTLTATATDTDASPDAGSFSTTVTVNPPLPTVNIDAPGQGSTVSGTVTVAGWAIDNSSVVGTAIGSVQIKVDGVVVGSAAYGASRPDVCAAYPGRVGCPNVGFTYQWNTTGLATGSHTLTATATDTDTSPDAGSVSVTVNR